MDQRSVDSVRRARRRFGFELYQGAVPVPIPAMMLTHGLRLPDLHFGEGLEAQAGQREQDSVLGRGSEGGLSGQATYEVIAPIFESLGAGKQAEFDVLDDRCTMPRDKCQRECQRLIPLSLE